MQVNDVAALEKLTQPGFHLRVFYLEGGGKNSLWNP